MNSDLAAINIKYFFVYLNCMAVIGYNIQIIILLLWLLEIWHVTFLQIIFLNKIPIYEYNNYYSDYFYDLLS